MKDVNWGAGSQVTVKTKDGTKSHLSVGKMKDTALKKPTIKCRQTGNRTEKR